MKRLELAGKKFGMLTAIEVIGRRGNFALWRCVCDCGNTSEVSSSNLVRNTRSCGCQKGAPRTREEIERHLLDNRTVTPTGCWEWTRAHTEHGYGITAALGLGWRRIRVTRLAMHLWREFDPNSERDILHRCDNPPCFNPDHLLEGDMKANVQDAISKGRFRLGEHNRQKTHCKRGHPFDESNTKIVAGNRRQCISCKRSYPRSRAA